ncbi:tyrosine-type recombinase/integrase [Streptomyces anulatus]|uniref:tyrosine-type recombinase/integrase n=1 Tax=Streptomyces anulatus TaxID=1892 RepID=UPI003B81A4A7
MSNKLARGMGSFFKPCACRRPSGCPHLYTIRFRNIRGKQAEESGFPTQDAAIERLTELYTARKTTPRSIAEQQETLGEMTFEDYAKAWFARKRGLTGSTKAATESRMRTHAYPEIGSRKMHTFDSFVVERFITAMEHSNVGAATQAQVFLRVKGILKDAHRRGIIGLDPLLDVSPPEYRPGPTVIPTKEQVGLLRAARDDDTFRLIVDLMAGMGLRNGEALAVNVNNMVAKDVYRVHQQVHDRTVTLEPLKHRKTGEFREVPLPSFVRESIEHYAATHGTFQGGYLLKTMRPSTGNAFLSPTTLRRWWTQLQTQKPNLVPGGMTMYSFRHYFASNALGQGIPITDVADWMGHSDINITFRTYRHLLPGSVSKAAKLLNNGLNFNTTTTEAPEVATAA